MPAGHAKRGGGEFGQDQQPEILGVQAELARQALGHLPLHPGAVVLHVSEQGRLAAADPDYGYQRFGDIVDELATKLTAHLAHEETDGLPLIDASLTELQWQHFAQVHTERIRGDAPMYMPWLLNGASPQMLDAILGKFPPPLLTAFREEWGPRYAALDIWNARLPGRA